MGSHIWKAICGTSSDNNGSMKMAIFIKLRVQMSTSYYYLTMEAIDQNAPYYLGI